MAQNLHSRLQGGGRGAPAPVDAGGEQLVVGGDALGWEDLPQAAQSGRVEDDQERAGILRKSGYDVVGVLILDDDAQNLRAGVNQIVHGAVPTEETLSALGLGLAGQLPGRVRHPGRL